MPADGRTHYCSKLQLCNDADYSVRVCDVSLVGPYAFWVESVGQKRFEIDGAGWVGWEVLWV